MEQTAFYDAVMVKHLEHSIDFEFLYTAVLCLKNNIRATTDDICRDFLQRGQSFYPGLSGGKGPASEVLLKAVEPETIFLKGVRAYLPAGTTVLQYHANAYLKLTALIPGISGRFFDQCQTGDVSQIIKQLCIELILPINYELPNAN